MKLGKTHGTLSRTSKLTTFLVVWIRAEYRAGKRGKTEASRFGISVNHYDKIGRGSTWDCLKGGGV